MQFYFVVTFRALYFIKLLVSTYIVLPKNLKYSRYKVCRALPFHSLSLSLNVVRYMV